MTQKNIGQLRARLKSGWTVDDLCKCIDHIATDPWHISNGQVRLELACRSDEQVQGCLAKLDAQHAPKLNKKDEAMRHAMDKFINRDRSLDL